MARILKTSEAGYSVKKGGNGKQQMTYGFKAHANVDEDGFIKKGPFDSRGNVHDSTQLEKLLTGSEAATYIDSAYKSKEHSALLKGLGIEERITHRAYRNTPLKDEQHE